MSEKTIVRLIKTFAALLLLIFGVTLWYYTMGRKPKLVLSVPIVDRTGSTSAHAAGPGEMLLVSGGKATLYDLARGAEKWTTSLSPKAPSAPVATAPVPAAAQTKLMKVSGLARPAVPAAPVAEEEDNGLRKLTVLPSGERPDLLLTKRVEKRRVRLVEWAAKLNAKRGTLKTPLQIEAFNEEAKKYHAELAEARREVASIQTPVVRVATEEGNDRDEPRSFGRFGSFFGKTEVIADGNAIVVMRDRSALLLDRATGKTTKEVALGGEVQHALRGVGCVFAISATPAGQREVTRIGLTDGAAQSIKVEAPEGQEGFRAKGPGQAFEPTVQERRAELSANGSALLQLDVRLVERKVVERQLVAAGAPSSLEEADKKTKGGVGNDAAIFAQALAEDAMRERTGGKERTDESTYEITLSRPFEKGVAPVSVQVQGHADVFSTKTLDLVATPHALLAFDHTNKKLWEAKLACAVAPRRFLHEEEHEKGPPCVEDGGRLYFFDQQFLSAFDLATGQPAWRIPNEGIRKVQIDGPGTLYVSSANGKEDEPGYRDEPIVLKVDAALGKILWKQLNYGDCIVTNGQLYVTRETRNAEDMVNAVFDESKAIECRWKIYKLSKRTGEPQWEWFQTRRARHIEGSGRTVGVVFGNELQVLKSIAL